MSEPRITVLLGLEGSGKTTLAVNAAAGLASGDRKSKVALVDLDVAHPGFQAAPFLRTLSDAGIAVVRQGGCDPFAGLPVLLSTVRRLASQREQRLVLDVGEDERSAAALRELNGELSCGKAEWVLVLNFCRPFTDEVSAAVEAARALEKATGHKLDSLACNTHLMGDTGEETIKRGVELTREAATRLKLGVWGVAVDEDLRPRLPPSVLVGQRVLVLQHSLRFAPEHPVRLSRSPVGPTFA